MVLASACPHLRAPGALCPGWADHSADPKIGETLGHRGPLYRIMAKSSR